jgi:hypothetical protein
MHTGSVSDELQEKIARLKVACVYKSANIDADEKKNAERQLQDILSPDRKDSKSEAPKDANELHGRVFSIRSKKFHKTITVAGTSLGQASLDLQKYQYADHQHFQLKQVVRSTKPRVSSPAISTRLSNCDHQFLRLSLPICFGCRVTHLSMNFTFWPCIPGCR